MQFMHFGWFISWHEVNPSAKTFGIPHSFVNFKKKNHKDVNWEHQEVSMLEICIFWFRDRLVTTNQESTEKWVWGKLNNFLVFALFDNLSKFTSLWKITWNMELFKLSLTHFSMVHIQISRCHHSVTKCEYTFWNYLEYFTDL